MSFFGSQQLSITGVTDPEGTSGECFTCIISPDQISHKRDIRVEEKDVGDTSGPVTQFKSYGPETVDFTLHFDNTGVIPGSEPVDDLIEDLSKVIYQYDGTIHKPLYHLVSWSSFVFRGQCTSFNVDYTLFKSDGTPLRCKVTLSFKGHKLARERAEEGNRNSPDLTHAKTIREGDSLPLMCKEVYGKMDYYLQVAEHNGLTNFRELEIGETIEFPPIER